MSDAASLFFIQLYIFGLSSVQPSLSLPNDFRLSIGIACVLQVAGPLHPTKDYGYRLGPSLRLDKQSHSFDWNEVN